jgi:hypothetical protein
MGTLYVPRKEQDIYFTLMCTLYVPRKDTLMCTLYVPRKEHDIYFTLMCTLYVPRKDTLMCTLYVPRKDTLMCTLYVPRKEHDIYLHMLWLFLCLISCLNEKNIPITGEVFNVIFWVYYKKIIYLRIKCSNFVWIIIH